MAPTHAILAPLRSLRSPRRNGYRPMKIPPLPYTLTDWSNVPATEHKGDTGMAYWRTLQFGDVRVRVVEYSPGYMADHWCDRGHVIYVLEGELTTELKDGRKFRSEEHQSELQSLMRISYDV